MTGRCASLPEPSFADWWEEWWNGDGRDLHDHPKLIGLAAWNVSRANEREARARVEAAIPVILDRQLKARGVVESARTLDAIYRAWRDNGASIRDTLTVMGKPLADLSAALKVLGLDPEKLGQQP